MQKNKIQELVQILEQDIDIKDFISNFVNLEKKGNNYIGLCPFHVDSNPSMVVSPSKGIYKCFSCGAGGNIIKFAQMNEGLTFIESLKFISEKFNINWNNYIDAIKIKIDPEENNIKKINLEAMKFFKFNLLNELKKDESEVKRYIEYRKFNGELIEKFNIGFTGEKNSLFEFLLNKGFSEEEILRSGLIKNYNGKLSTYFNNRIIFPIQNENQEVLGFSGRVFLKDDSNAKYLNSIENKIFKKRNISYNLNNSKKEILKNNSVIILEGFMDVIALDKVEIKNTIASMGIEFNFESIKKLTNNFILAFDNDEAGLNANLRIGKKLLSNNINPKVLVLKGYKDFDELINNNLSLNIKKIIDENKIDFVDFLIFNLLNVFKNERVQESKLKEVISFINLIDDNLLKQKYINDLKSKMLDNFNIDISYLLNFKNEFNGANNNINNNLISKTNNNLRNKNDFLEVFFLPLKNRENEIIFYALKRNWFIKYLKEEIKNNNFSFYFGVNKAIFDKIILLYEKYFTKENNQIDIAKLSEELTKDEIDYIDKILKNEKSEEDIENLPYFYKELIKKQKVNYLELKNEILLKEMNSPNLDQNRSDEIFNKFKNNDKKLKETKLND